MVAQATDETEEGDVGVYGEAQLFLRLHSDSAVYPIWEYLQQVKAAHNKGMPAQWQHMQPQFQFPFLLYRANPSSFIEQRGAEG